MPERIPNQPRTPEPEPKRKWTFFPKPKEGGSEASRWTLDPKPRSGDKKEWTFFAKEGLEQREQKTARAIWQTSAGALGLPVYGLVKVGDLIKWLLKQSKETADIAKGWEEGQALVGMPGR